MWKLRWRMINQCSKFMQEIAEVDSQSQKSNSSMFCCQFWYPLCWSWVALSIVCASFKLVLVLFENLKGWHEALKTMLHLACSKWSINIYSSFFFPPHGHLWSGFLKLWLREHLGQNYLRYLLKMQYQHFLCSRIFNSKWKEGLI